MLLFTGGLLPAIHSSEWTKAVCQYMYVCIPTNVLFIPLISVKWPGYNCGESYRSAYLNHGYLNGIFGRAHWTVNLAWPFPVNASLNVFSWNEFYCLTLWIFPLKHFSMDLSSPLISGFLLPTQASNRCQYWTCFQGESEWFQFWRDLVWIVSVWKAKNQPVMMIFSLNHQWLSGEFCAYHPCRQQPSILPQKMIHFNCVSQCSSFFVSSHNFHPKITKKQQIETDCSNLLQAGEFIWCAPQLQCVYYNLQY